MTSQQRYQYHAILVGDSRIKGFKTLDQGKYYTYKTHYICKPGAAVGDLKEDIQDLIDEIPCRNTTLLIKIAAGINNTTSKVNRSRCYEIAPSTSTADNVIHELKALKSDIKEHRPDAIVSFITIAPVVFLKQLQFLKDRRKIKHPIYNNSDREGFQGPHEEKILEINSEIKKLNHQEQEGITCYTASWDSEVLRRQRGTYRLIPGALYDGIHPTEKVTLKWYSSFHKAINKEIKQHQDLQTN